MVSYWPSNVWTEVNSQVGNNLSASQGGGLLHVRVLGSFLVILCAGGVVAAQGFVLGEETTQRLCKELVPYGPHAEAGHEAEEVKGT